MTVSTQSPLKKAKPWPLEELGALVKDFLEYAKEGLEWQDVNLAAAGPYNYPAIEEFAVNMANSEKYRDFASLHFFERIDGDKEEAFVLAYRDERNGDEIGRLKVVRA